MNLGKPVTKSPQADKLLAADAQASGYSDQDPAVAPCPYREQPPNVEPFRVLLWNVQELGGGFYMPAARPAHLIDAYAAVISGLDVDICVLMGVREHQGATLVEKQMADGTPCFAWEPPTEETGPKEVGRILRALQTADAAGGWTSAFARADDGAVLYRRQGTTCFLYRTSKGVQLDGAELAAGVGEERVGLPEELLCGRFRVPADDGSLVDVPILASFAVFESQRFGRGGALPDETNGQAAARAVSEVPEPWLLAVSAPADLVAGLGGLNRFRAAVDADYQPLPTHGSVLKPGFWETIVEECDYLVDNLHGLNPADVVLQDEAMHWEALDPPDHPDALEDVAGHLSDLILVRNGEAARSLVLEDLRVVDLVRAALLEGALKGSGGEGDEPLEEDGILASYLQQHREGNPPPVTSEADDEPENVLNACMAFVRQLSDHWPVVVTVHVKPSS